ncbi:MAG: FCD domain-containing protein [Brevibacterium aurantiacum]|uniref:GntR family transcriptional regulator n=1 Tax=Brevibacterium aurantiacum TaxID=273384 RepID=A0A2A3ZGY4_BREAU|nr:FCD domain-containing protein [Brevibacterium aurantiacum]MDN5594772.1 GntR family transcriptional regulator [Brevibacterium sp.]MDN5607329.1 GntR family transcriptional regulator [Brevibacterium sp.]MDN5712815.1 GntR family transcriptional regulator [Brevibacterium aurantiacum]MDN6379711.1 GntR family transcriptional regulator [Brevibacterium aurantiacum]PCC50721.1 GntR family transcriptional regulator [Brevibacterium aurantiacum]
MYSSEMRRAAVAGTASSSIAEVAAQFGVSPSSLRRWMLRSDLEDRPRSGRPQIQSTADQVVEALVSTAGARISGKDYSTRALAEATGLSQSIVSRAMRGMTVPRDQVRGGDEITVVAGGFPLVIIGIRAADQRGGDDSAGSGGDGGGGSSAVSARRVQRRIAGIVAALRSAGVKHWPQRFDSEHRQTDASAMLELLQAGGQRERFLVFDPHKETSGGVAESQDTAESAAIAVHRDFAEFLDAAKSALATCRDVPGSLLDMLAARVRHGFEGVMWKEASHNDAQRSSISSDSMEISSWLPKETRSITEHLAIALREEIIDSGYEPGDRINPRLLSRRMQVPRSSVDAALRRMVDDKLLDGSRGGTRIPLITTLDVLDLYAGRMAVGEVLLRSLALRPKRYFVPVQLALRQVEASAATKSGIDVEDADLHFQQELARASGLRQSTRAFEALTLRLRLFISVLQLDYSPASDRILIDDRAIFKALSLGDADTAVSAWRGKVDNAVRHMAGLFARRRFDQDLWAQLTRSG